MSDRKRFELIWAMAALALVLALALVSCGGVTDPAVLVTPAPDDARVVVGQRITGAFYRYVDAEAGVVCWTHSDAIDCMPIGETKLSLPGSGR